MNWTTEVPKESGWYWVRFHCNESPAEIVYLIDDCLWVAGSEDLYSMDDVFVWANKLEIPE